MKPISNEQTNRTSTYLICLAFVLLGLGMGMTYLVYNTVKNLQNDASVINHTGIIRGSIQRATKLRLAGDIDTSKQIIKTINDKMEAFICSKNSGSEFYGGRNVVLELETLNTNWQELKFMLDDYGKNPDATLKKRIIATSENCWQAADSAVSSAQLSTENKVAGIKIFYFFLALNAANIFSVIWFVYVKVRRQLEFQASYDLLTSLLNRHSYEAEILREITRSVRYDRNLSLIILDIDHFKVINDTHGHKAGDLVLRDLAGVIAGNVRRSDSVFRIGGEEFAVIVPETNTRDTWNLAEKIRHEVESHDFPLVGKVTISSGVSRIEKDDDAGSLFRKSDEALYRAKKNGRNRVEVYGEDLDIGDTK